MTWEFGPVSVCMYMNVKITEDPKRRLPLLSGVLPSLSLC